MPTSKNPNTYHDVELIFQTARDNGGLRYEMESPRAAISWRRRAYTYRSLLSKLGQQRSNIPGFVPPTKWDDVFLSLDGSTVVIEFSRVGGTLRTLDGKEVTPAKITPQVEQPAVPAAAGDDPLLSAALELMGKDDE